MNVRLFIFCALLSFASAPGIYADPDPTVAALEASYKDLIEKVGEPLAHLRAKYLESIEAWKLQSQQNGDLPLDLGLYFGESSDYAIWIEPID